MPDDQEIEQQKKWALILRGNVSDTYGTPYLKNRFGSILEDRGIGQKLDYQDFILNKVLEYHGANALHEALKHLEKKDIRDLSVDQSRPVGM